MTTTEATGPISPPLPQLEPKAQLALLARILQREGWDDHVAGHITYRLADGCLLVNPYAWTWDEVRASDVMTVDREGRVVEGKWQVSSAIALHLELHKARSDVVWAVHNHPRWATIWAGLGRVPLRYDQMSAFIRDDIAMFSEYKGGVSDPVNAREAVAAMGAAPAALLANHGVFVVGEDVAQTYIRCSALEWRCRQAWHVEAVGEGTPMPKAAADWLGARVETRRLPEVFAAMARRELRADPTVLD